MLDNYFSIIMVVLSILAVFTPVIMIGSEIFSNSNLDDDSKDMISSITGQVNQNFNESDFQEQQLSVSENASFESVDPFARQSLESQAGAEKRTSMAQRMTQVPDLILDSIGIPERFVAPIRNFIGILIGILLSFATYNAVLNKRISRRNI